MSGMDEKATIECPTCRGDGNDIAGIYDHCMNCNGTGQISSATTPADVGELVERLRERARTMNGAEPVGAGDGHTYTLCYYSAGDRGLDREAATALERVTAERDAAQRSRDQSHEDAMALLGKVKTLTSRAEAAEAEVAEVARLSALLAEADEVIARVLSCGAFDDCDSPEWGDEDVAEADRAARRWQQKREAK